jgi:hypothetical protein
MVSAVRFCSSALGIERKWLSARASPCQGDGRECESRLPLHRAGRRSQVVRQGSAKPRSPVRIRPSPLGYLWLIVNWGAIGHFSLSRGRWRNGRRYGLKIRSRVTGVWVRIPPALQSRIGNSCRTRRTFILGAGLSQHRRAASCATKSTADLTKSHLPVNCCWQ